MKYAAIVAIVALAIGSAGCCCRAPASEQPPCKIAVWSRPSYEELESELAKATRALLVAQETIRGMQAMHDQAEAREQGK